MTSLTDHLIPLAVAVAIGLVLGLERELAHKPAGLRTQLARHQVDRLRSMPEVIELRLS